MWFFYWVRRQDFQWVEWSFVFKAFLARFFSAIFKGIDYGVFVACILLTGGRAPVTLDLARLFARLGHRVLVAESQNAQLCRSSRAIAKTFLVPPPRQFPQEFVQHLLNIVEEENVDFVIPTCEEVFYISRGRKRFPSRCHVWVDDFQKISNLHNKWTFNQTASKSGLLTPQTFLIYSQEALREHLERKGEWILKPAFSRFGNSIHQGSIETMLHAAIDFDDGKVWVLQKLIHGPEYCVYAVANKGEIRACSIYAHEFLAGRAGICFEEIDCPVIEKDVREYLQKIEFTGQIAFDFIIEEGRAYALECNPRATSGIHLLTAKDAFADVFVKSMVTPLVRAEIGSQAALGLAMLTFALPQIHSFHRLRRWASIMGASREVLFSWNDPLPFFDQLVCLAQLCWQSWRSGLDLLATSTADIEWNGES
jgi:predicted ATP-grasp superfamily ATP-dependent carboligase